MKKYKPYQKSHKFPQVRRKNVFQYLIKKFDSYLALITEWDIHNNPIEE